MTTTMLTRRQITGHAPGNSDAEEALRRAKEADKRPKNQLLALPRIIIRTGHPSLADPGHPELAPSLCDDRGAEDPSRYPNEDLETPDED